MPDIEFASLDVIPEGLKEFAETKNGKIVVDVGPNKKIKEFRDNNIALSQERDGLKGKLTSFVTHIGHDDPEKFATEWGDLRNTSQLVKDGKLKGDDTIQKQVDARAKDIEGVWSTKVNALTVERDNALRVGGDFKAKFQRSVLDQAVTNAVLHKDSGAEASALPDILARAHSVFVVTDNGGVEARNGDQVVYSKKDGTTKMSVAEWLTDVLATAPHLQKLSNGAGGSGNRNSGDKFHGYSEEAWKKLSPAERLTKAREAQR